MSRGATVDGEATTGGSAVVGKEAATGRRVAVDHGATTGVQTGAGSAAQHAAAGQGDPSQAGGGTGAGGVQSSHAACRHCGSQIPADALFCGSGCAYAHRMLHERKWERFYNIRDRVIAPVGDTAFAADAFTWITQAVTKAETAADGRGAELTLALQGASCAACVWLIAKIFDDHCSSGRIDVDLHSARLHLHWQPHRLDAVAFARAMQRFGYNVGPLAAGGNVRQPSNSRKMLRRIGLCAAFQMNVMLYTLPVYFGMEADFTYAWLFSTMSMLFGTLSVWFGGSYFIRRAWTVIRKGGLSIDLPLSLGIIGSYVGSMVGWAMQAEQYIYFDFVSSFILLMLIGRWAKEVTLERNRKRLSGLQPIAETVQRLDHRGREAPIAREQLQAGDCFHVGSAQRVPVEAVLESASAQFDLAWVNGEPQPQLFYKGQRVPAGARSVGLSTVSLIAGEAWNDSLMAQLLQKPQQQSYRNRLIEAVVRGYLIGILAIACLAGVVWLFAAGWWQAGAIVTAVLVVSCPCALGLAVPLADELAIVALRRAGVFVRTGDLWERLAQVRRVVFDKTGTLTFEMPHLSNPQALDALYCSDAKTAATSEPRTAAGAVLPQGAARSAAGNDCTPCSVVQSAGAVACAAQQPPGGGAGGGVLSQGAALSPAIGLPQGIAPVAALLTLVQDNPHPVARSLHRALLVRGAPPPLGGQVQEAVGYGVNLEGWSLGREGWLPNEAHGAHEPMHEADASYEAHGLHGTNEVDELGVSHEAHEPDASHGAHERHAASETRQLNGTDDTESAATVFAYRGQVLAKFYFTESVRADARHEVAQLQKHGFACEILSGDSQGKVDAMSAALGLPQKTGVGGLSPQQKAEHIGRNSAAPALMVGDGANDSLAFDKALCRGTPIVYRGILERKADFYYMGQGLAGIGALFRINAARKRTEILLIAFMVVYNILAVGAAVAGWINPLIAAILMPLSSLATLGIVAVSMRAVWLSRS